MKESRLKVLLPNKSGFTLIELLVVISIIGILFTVGLATYNEFNRRQVLNGAVKTLRNDLRLAQSKAMAGEKPTGCGILDGYRVSFTAGNYQIIAVCGVSTFTVGIYPLPTNVTFNPLPSAIIFKSLAQGVSGFSGSVTIILTAFGQTNSVVVTESGNIYEQ